MQYQLGNVDEVKGTGVWSGLELKRESESKDDSTKDKDDSNDDK